jgi:hypothetical protein
VATIAIEILATMAQYSIVVALALLRAAHKKRPNVASHQDPLVLNRRARLFMGLPDRSCVEDDIVSAFQLGKAD